MELFSRVEKIIADDTEAKERMTQFLEEVCKRYKVKGVEASFKGDYLEIIIKEKVDDQKFKKMIIKFYERVYKNSTAFNFSFQMKSGEILKGADLLSVKELNRLRSYSERNRDI